MEFEVELAKQAIQGNDDAFLQLMYQYKVDLYKTALAFLRNEGEALEAIQEVTYRAYKNVRTLREPAFFKTWLIRIMINYCHNELAKGKRVMYDNESLERVEAVFDDSSFEIEEALLKLDERSRELLILKYFHGYKIKEIAKQFRCPEGTIKTWLNKALKSFRENLDEKGGSMNV